MIKSEAEIRKSYMRILKNYRENVASGLHAPGNIGEVTGSAGFQRGTLNAMEWILGIENRDEIKTDEE